MCWNLDFCPLASRIDMQRACKWKTFDLKVEDEKGEDKDKISERDRLRARELHSGWWQRKVERYLVYKITVSSCMCVSRWPWFCWLGVVGDNAERGKVSISSKISYLMRMAQLSQSMINFVAIIYLSQKIVSFQESFFGWLLEWV